MSIVYNGDKRKIVKNLGWLLRNWKKVVSFHWYDNFDNSRNDGFFLASLDDGKVFYSDYASYTIFVHWLNRPVFRGLPVTIYKSLPDGSFPKARYTLEIGRYEKMVAW